MSAAPEEVVAPLELRSLTFADLPGIMRIERESFTTPWRESTFHGLLLRRDSDLIGAARLGRLVGYAVSWTAADQAELGNLAVASEERRRGTGRRLVMAALDNLRARGARECFLEVRESNETALHLYETCGFRPVGRRRKYYTYPIEDALVMCRQLD